MVINKHFSFDESEDDQIKLVNLNNVYFKILTENAILEEMSEYFTFYVPGYRHMKSFKQKIWDGKIRLIDRKRRTIYRGLLYSIKKFCDDRNYKLIYDKENIEQISEQKLSEFLNSLSLPFELRDYQITAFKHAIENKRCCILSSVASGKSVIIYLIIRYFLNHLVKNDKKCLIIVPTVNLVEQFSSDLNIYENDLINNIQKIYSGEKKINSNDNRQIVISTWQSLYNMDEKYFEQFDLVIVDEAHFAKAAALKNTLTKINAEYRIGTTGTIHDTDCHMLVIEGLLGEVFKASTTKELMDKSLLAKTSIKCIVLNYNEEEKSLCKRLKYKEEIDFLISHKKRNSFIKKLAVSLNGNTLVLFTFVEKHGIPFFEKLKETLPENKKAFFVSGKTEIEDRESIRNIIETESNAIIVASYGVFSTGVNIKNLENIIFSSPSKARIRILQSIGRVLRLGRSDKAIVYDIVDDLSYKRTKNFALKHFVERMKIYDAEEYEYSIYKVNF